MRETTRTKSETIYVCGACGYDSRFERDVLEHEERHGRSEPFETGMEVSYTTTFTDYDHGKAYEAGQVHTGRIVRFESHDPRYPDDEQFDDGRYALVEGDDGSRDWVGEFDLREVNAEENQRRKEAEAREATEGLIEDWEEKNEQRNDQKGWAFASTDFYIASDSSDFSSDYTVTIFGEDSS